MLAPEVTGLIDAVADQGLVIVLTGAGVSAASGIPTFRGPEGYWTVGSTVHTPMQLATRAMFRNAPDEVWGWYLYRLGVCRSAAPNDAHIAVVDLERGLGDDFLLITQNVDGLHLRAGSSPSRTFQVHGAIELMRCASECRPDVVPIPEGLATPAPGEELTEAHRDALRCPACGGAARPHVLWFDETYDEVRYRYDSALDAAARAALVVTAGTSGATTLPNLVVETAARSGAALLDVNPEHNPFGELAEHHPRGAVVRAHADEALPAIAARILAAR